MNSTNGNSALSDKSQHGYEILDGHNDNIAVKTGVSGGRITADGQSYRGNSQAARWNKNAGEPGRYQSVLVKSIPEGPGARKDILQWESENAARLRAIGQLADPTKHVRP
ncbi:hypothetical protein [Pseudomonas sp. MAFF 301350]|uniref:Tox-URI2 domain-containing protein n=1 Tax=Pseudomonas aegrilactucae TaxID=2854028 RepID=A0A9Q2XPC0_9PSED|nr:hypothetical protein [Pseudomonas aegrilactucae]